MSSKPFRLRWLSTLPATQGPHAPVPHSMGRQDWKSHAAQPLFGLPGPEHGPWQWLWLHREDYSVVGGQGGQSSLVRNHIIRKRLPPVNTWSLPGQPVTQVRSPVRRSAYGTPDPSRPLPQTHIIPKSGARAKDAAINGVWVWFGFHLETHEFSSDHFSNHSSNELNKIVQN